MFSECLHIECRSKCKNQIHKWLFQCCRCVNMTTFHCFPAGSHFFYTNPFTLFFPRIDIILHQSIKNFCKRKCEGRGRGTIFLMQKTEQLPDNLTNKALLRHSKELFIRHSSQHEVFDSSRNYTDTTKLFNITQKSENIIASYWRSFYPISASTSHSHQSITYAGSNLHMGALFQRKRSNVR